MVDLDLPEPCRGEVLVRVEACGIGLTVVNYIDGELGDDPSFLPRIPGHELVGTVEAVGPGVDPARMGERVMAYFYLSCGRCPRCLEGFEPLCRDFGGFLGVARDGGFAQFAVLPEFNALSVPADIEAVDATVIPDATATSVHVCHRSTVRPGERVAVIAAGGGLGLHMLQVARAFGAQVVGLDVADEKLAFIEDELGVAAIDSSDFADTRLPASWDGTADVIVDFLGRPDSARWAIDNLDSNGRLVCLTVFRDTGFPISQRELVLGQTAVIGSRYCSRTELQTAADLVLCGVVKPVVSRKAGIAEIGSVIQELRAGSLLGRGALVW
jgi:D-arabinose 1-dehydrogenase-like Zn-dependent alcohol dehydrogenase